MKGNVFIDVEKCLACKRCEIACAVEHSSSKALEAAILELPLPESRVSVEPHGGFSIPLECRHCENAQCVAVCPTGAMTRVDEYSPVHIRHELCVGCRDCVVVCHFGVPRVSRDGKTMIKCDQCLGRIDQDVEPACVTACPTGALAFRAQGEIAGVLRTKGFSERFVRSE